MVKRILLIIGVIVLVLILIEVFCLLQLRASLRSYAAYWQDRKEIPGEITYIALGDSAAQGIGASQPENGYVGLIAERIKKETGKSVRVINLSVSGARLQDVIDDQLPVLAQYKPDIVTIEAGANDVATSYDQGRFKREFETLAAQLPEGTIVGNMPYFGGRISRNAQAIDANKIIDRVADRHGLVVADLQTITRERDGLLVYACDFFHPSNRGYQNWADAFWMELKPRL